MKIGEAARAGGVSARALRYYEDEGLITPERGANGYRYYSPAMIDRVRVIRYLAHSGLPMKLIQAVLPHLPAEPRQSAVCAAFLAQVEKCRDGLAERIASLAAQQAALEAFLGTARTEA